MRNPLLNGKPHSLVVLRVLESDGAGRPSKCSIGYDDTTFDISDKQAHPNEFVTAFVPSHMTQTRARH